MVDTARLPIPPRPKFEMNVVGYGMALILVVVMLPLLPVLLAAWVLDALVGRQPSPESEEERRFDNPGAQR